jgi:hypothetical protein
VSAIERSAPVLEELRKVEQLRIHAIKNEYDRAITEINVRYGYEKSKAEASTMDKENKDRLLSALSEGRRLEMAAADQKLVYKQKAEAEAMANNLRDLQYEGHRIRISQIEDIETREVQSINLKYDLEMKRLKEVKHIYAEEVQLQTNRQAELAAASDEAFKRKSRESEGEGKKSADHAEMMQDLALTASLKGTALEAARLKMARERAIAAADPDKIGEVEREYDLRQKIFDFSGNNSATKGIFNAAAIASLQSGPSGGAQERTASGVAALVIEVKGLREDAKNNFPQFAG